MVLRQKWSPRALALQRSVQQAIASRQINEIATSLIQSPCEPFWVGHRPERTPTPPLKFLANREYGTSDPSTSRGAQPSQAAHSAALSVPTQFYFRKLVD